MRCICEIGTQRGDGLVDALSAQIKGSKLYIYDESGNASLVTISDVNQSNGVIHVVNAVLVPK